MAGVLALSGAMAAIALTAAAASPAPSPEAMEDRILAAANAFRADNHLAPLRSDPILAGQARAFAEYLARTGKFSHTADGRDPGQRARAAGYDYCDLAENIAFASDDSGFEENRLVRVFMNGWEHSPGHRRNLLDPEAVQTGVGVARTPGEVQTYLAVEEFGRPASMRYSFSVVNGSDAPAAYDFGGEHHVLPPYATLTENTCATGDIAFGHVAGAPSRYAAEPGARYVLSRSPGGVQVAVAAERRRPSGARPAQH